MEGYQNNNKKSSPEFCIKKLHTVKHFPHFICYFNCCYNHLTLTSVK